jgi:hypothetical protein
MQFEINTVARQSVTHLSVALYFFWIQKIRARQLTPYLNNVEVTNPSNKYTYRFDNITFT